MKNKFPIVDENKKYEDITFCNNSKCTFKKCYRHVCHNSNPYYYSLADFNNTEYCHLTKEESDEK